MATFAIGGAAVQTRRDGSTAASPNTRVRDDGQRERQQSASTIDEILDGSFPASDPPSWTGAISRVAAASNTSEHLLGRIRAEFLEMPGLCLTIEQARRLWCLEPRVCEALMNSLIASRFLRRTNRGLFVRC